MAAMTEMLASTEKSHVVQLTDEQRLDWLRLIRSDHVGPRTFRALINHLGGARAALAGLPDLARRGGLRGPPRILSREDAAREIAAARSHGVRLVATGEPDYPQRLKMIDDAPPLLAVRGNAGAGFAIVSGLARGIDAAAHRGSLATGTVAVLAGGQDKIYPPEHASLAEAIPADGALVSEMPMGWEPRARDFPRRNRLISGLAAGVVIVEAAKRSGSLITARFALEQGREVFAVPGSPLDPRSEGSNGRDGSRRRDFRAASDPRPADCARGRGAGAARPIRGRARRRRARAHRRPARADAGADRRSHPPLGQPARGGADGAARARARGTDRAPRRRIGVDGVTRARPAICSVLPLPPSRDE